jgi:hypothetical protein
MQPRLVKPIEQWGIFELELAGDSSGNPFVEVTLEAVFQQNERVFSVSGFYDGNGVYCVRFMPDAQGEWHYRTRSNRAELDGHEGRFNVTTPAAQRHGIVRVANTYHFAYSDGTPYYPFGTTCYAWVHQQEELQEQTLASLQAAKFNKIRMCVFPKYYPYNESEPALYPFERDAAGESDFARFNPAYFQHLERRIAQLQALGIEADLILWHPYDRWGYSQMDEESDTRYLRYLIARLAAYSNLWWSLANEYDFMLNFKPMERWDRFFEILRAEDPYQHLRSIHNGDVNKNYDHTKPGVTHVCIQNWNVKRVREWRQAYAKPILNDEFEYEGNIPFAWGNISAQEVVHRFWIMVTNGAYAGHGETYEHPDDLLWWSHGGVLHGESWKRIAFLRQIIEDAPAGGLTPIEQSWVWSRVSGGMNGDYRLIYFGEHQPIRWWDGLPQGSDYDVDIIDTWNMTITPGALQPTRRFAAIEEHMQMPDYELVLPGKPFLAVRIRKQASRT